MGGTENGMETRVDRDHLPMDQPTYEPSQSSAQVSVQCLQEKEGWEVAGTRKSRRKNVTQRNQYGSANQNTGWAWGEHSMKNSGGDSTPDPYQKQGGVRPQPWRRSGAPIEGLKKPKETAHDKLIWHQLTAKEAAQYKFKSPASEGAVGEEKWESMMIMGKGKNYKDGTSGTSLDNDVDIDTQESGLRNHSVVVASVPNKSLDAIAGECQPHIAGVWRQRMTAKAISGNSTWSNTHSQFGESQLLTNLLPSVKQGGLAESTHGVANVGPDPRSTAERTGNLGAPYSHLSDSICSYDDVDDDRDLAGSEGLDSDASDVGHETWDTSFKLFFGMLAALTVDQLNENDKQWHCPVCQDGVGAVDSYRGLQPLLAHANTVTFKRVKLHRSFAKVLEEEMNSRYSIQNEEMFRKWKGPCEDGATLNPLIVWPPAIIVQNTQLEFDDHEKWIGMGNEELRNHFKDYNFSKARHAYGPQGHRGMSILVFPESPTGYMDAQRLAKHFIDSRRGRENWDQPGKVLFHPGGMRILYGYMASAEDMNIFNRHTGKSKLKWNHSRLQDVVVQPMRQMDEDNYQLNRTNKKNERLTEVNNILEKSSAALTEKLRLKEKEIETLRYRAFEQHQEDQKEMDQQEFLYKTKVQELLKSRVEREEEIQQKEEDFTQEHIWHVHQLEETRVAIPKEDISEKRVHLQQAKIEEEIAHRTELVEISLKDTEDYELQKKEIIRKHHLKKVEFMRQQYEEMLELEKEFEKERLRLQERYLH